MNLTKPFYSITETAKMLNVNASLLRYWEKEFKQIKPYKNKKGDRFFRPEDIEVIQTIYNLTKVKGFTLQGAKDELARNFENAKAQARAVAAIERIRARLIDIRQELD